MSEFISGGYSSHDFLKQLRPFNSSRNRIENNYIKQELCDHLRDVYNELSPFHKWCVKQVFIERQHPLLVAKTKFPRDIRRALEFEQNIWDAIFDGVLQMSEGLKKRGWSVEDYWDLYG